MFMRAGSAASEHASFLDFSNNITGHQPVDGVAAFSLPAPERSLDLASPQIGEKPRAIR
jgi:hypothetical protein